MWVDISLLDTGDVFPGLTKEEALKRFHLLDYKGRLLSGAKAFAALWLVLPPFKLLGRIAQKEPFTFILELLYRIFLLIRPLPLISGKGVGLVSWHISDPSG